MGAGVFDQIASIAVQVRRSDHIVAELPVRRERAARFKLRLVAGMAEGPPGIFAQGLRKIAAISHRQRLENHPEASAATDSPV